MEMLMSFCKSLEQGCRAHLLAESNGALGRHLGATFTRLERPFTGWRVGVAAQSSVQGRSPRLSPLREMGAYIADCPPGARAGPGPACWLQRCTKISQGERLGSDHIDHLR